MLSVRRVPVIVDVENTALQQRDIVVCEDLIPG
jgi:hypothetical protein